MLLPAVVRWVIIGGGLALAIGGIKIVRRRGQRPASKIPDATVVAGAAASFRRVVLRWLPALSIPIGLALTLWAAGHDIEYLVVTDGYAGPEVARRYGSDRKVDFPLAPGAKQPEPDDLNDPHWVINRCSRTVRVSTTQYGHVLGFGRNEPFQIPPGTAAHFGEIEHVGPNDPPPASVRDEYNLGIQFRHWLTW